MRKSSVVWLALAALWSAPLLATPQARPVQWKVGEQAFSGYLVHDDASKEVRPGLVMVPNWMGVTDSAVEKAKEIAGEDYVVLVADVYGTGVRPKDAAEAGAQVREVYSDGGVALRARVEAAIDVLKAQAGKAPIDATRIGALGFCFGGSAVLELARAGSDISGGVVSLHGGLDTYLPATGNAIRTSILVLNGADDSSVSAQNIVDFKKEMDAAKADWQFVNFGGAVHCFTQPESNSPPNCVYNERGARRAMRMMRDFFRERFAN